LKMNASWRGYFPVLDRTAGTEPVETAILEGVERFELRFLPALSAVESDRNDVIDLRNWQDNWIADLSQPGANALTTGCRRGTDGGDRIG
jgi:hypothetical protein